MQVSTMGTSLVASSTDMTRQLSALYSKERAARAPATFQSSMQAGTGGASDEDIEPHCKWAITGRRLAAPDIANMVRGLSIVALKSVSANQAAGNWATFGVITSKTDPMYVCKDVAVVYSPPFALPRVV